MFDDEPTPEELHEAEMEVQREIEDWDPKDLPESQEQLLADLNASGAPEEMQKNVLRGLYHDYVSEHPMPKMLLVNHCRDADLPEVARRTKEGRYDP